MPKSSEQVRNRLRPAGHRAPGPPAEPAAGDQWVLVPWELPALPQPVPAGQGWCRARRPRWLVDARGCPGEEVVSLLVLELAGGSADHGEQHSLLAALLDPLLRMMNQRQPVGSLA